MHQKTLGQAKHGMIENHLQRVGHAGASLTAEPGPTDSVDVDSAKSALKDRLATLGVKDTSVLQPIHVGTVDDAHIGFQDFFHKVGAHLAAQVDDPISATQLYKQLDKDRDGFLTEGESAQLDGLMSGTGVKSMSYQDFKVGFVPASATAGAGGSLKPKRSQEDEASAATQQEEAREHRMKAQHAYMERQRHIGQSHSAHNAVLTKAEFEPGLD